MQRKDNIEQYSATAKSTSAPSDVVPATTNQTTTAIIAKNLSPDAPEKICQSSPYRRENEPHRYMTPGRPDDLDPPPGYVRRQVGITGSYHWDQPVEDYYRDLTMNYS